MALKRLLLSFPLRRQTVIGALLIATVLFIVYQFTFVAELNESSKQQHRGSTEVKRSHQSQQKEPGENGKHKHVENKHFFKDVNVMSNVDTMEKMLEKYEGNLNRVKAKQDDIIKENQHMKHKDLDKNNIEDTGKKVHSAQQFVCKSSGKVISSDKVNDDYCDCPEDGSDEPRTNACSNGKFVCVKHSKQYPKSIPSAWVNDGVCDCCDGSDEWKMKKMDEGPPVELQGKVGRYLSPCPDVCPGKMN